MLETDPDRLQAIGRMTVLKEEITRLSREIFNHLRSLHGRIETVTPSTVHEPPVAHLLDVGRCRGDLESIAAADARLEEVLAEYNALAAKLGVPGLKRMSW